MVIKKGLPFLFTFPYSPRHISPKRVALTLSTLGIKHFGPLTFFSAFSLFGLINRISRKNNPSSPPFCFSTHSHSAHRQNGTQSSLPNDPSPQQVIHDPDFPSQSHGACPVRQLRHCLGRCLRWWKGQKRCVFSQPYPLHRTIVNMCVTRRISLNPLVFPIPDPLSITIAAPKVKQQSNSFRKKKVDDEDKSEVQDFF